MPPTDSATTLLHEPDPGEPTRPARPLLRRDAASRYLKETWGVIRAPATLAKLAVIGGGPPFHRAGRWPLYGPDHLDVWALELIGEARTCTSEHDVAELGAAQEQLAPEHVG